MNKKILLGVFIGIILVSLCSADLGNWSIRLGVQGERYKDSYNFFGAVNGASILYDDKDLPEPPESPSGLSLYFAHEDWGYQSGRYSSDFRPPLGGPEMFEFVVESKHEAELTLFWMEEEPVPEMYRITLIDEAAGTTVDMREVGAYAFRCTPGAKNVFRILVEYR